jgi:DNA-directed RNA polymerase specialized sigma24 family protein
MFGIRKVKNGKQSPYAMRSDFCRIFEKDMNRLYRLSYLLTGDETVAEQCFVGGLHISQEAGQVFKEWAESWARRSIIQNAIRMLRPRATIEHIRSTSDPDRAHAPSEKREFAAVVDLPAFERFVFVMSVLERYSDQECSVLLSCSRRDVADARTRALARLGELADLRRKLVSIAPHENARRDKAESTPQLTSVPSLAASA